MEYVGEGGEGDLPLLGVLDLGDEQVGDHEGEVVESEAEGAQRVIPLFLMDFGDDGLEGVEGSEQDHEVYGHEHDQFGSWLHQRAQVLTPICYIAN